MFLELTYSFNTVNGKYCCNLKDTGVEDKKAALAARFNTVNGKYCCNLNGFDYFDGSALFKFQYRKR